MGKARLRSHLEATDAPIDPALINGLTTLLKEQGGVRALTRLDRTLRPVRGSSELRRTVLQAMLDVARPDQLPTVFHRAVATRDMDVAEAAAQRIEPSASAEAAVAVADWSIYGGNSAAAADLYSAALAKDAGDSRATLGLAIVSLEQGDNRRAADLAEGAARHLPSLRRSATAHLIRAASRLWADRPPISTVDTLFFCHPTKKLKHNTDLGPPGVGLLSKAVASWRTYLRAPGRAVVLYDHRAGEDAFRDNVARFCRDEGLELIANQSNGLRKQWLAAFAATSADAALVVEQDHEFVGRCPSLREMVDLLNARPDISHLRLNRRNTVRVRFDLALEQGHRDGASGLVRTSRFSNTPHLIRRDYFDAVVHPMIAEVSHRDDGNFGAAGVEETVNASLYHAESEIGLPAVMRLAGTAIWGNLDDPRVAVHTGV